MEMKTIEGVLLSEEWWRRVLVEGICDVDEHLIST